MDNLNLKCDMCIDKRTGKNKTFKVLDGLFQHFMTKHVKKINTIVQVSGKTAFIELNGKTHRLDLR